MTIKNRLAKLEKQTQPEKAGDVFTVRKVNYRAGIIEGVQDTPGAIPVKLVDYMRRNDEHKEQTSET